MKIRIEFEIEDEKAKGYDPKELRDRLKKALLDGLGCLVSDYPQGRDVEDLYEMVRVR